MTNIMKMVKSPLEVVRGSLDMPEISITPASSYQAFTPAVLDLADTWAVPAQHFSTPDSVLEWLPQPLSAPQTGVKTLELLERLESLPQQTAQTWIENLLQRALPTLPELPPETIEAWRSRWFDEDTFGIGRVLSQRYPLPPVPYVPLYDIGVNLEWLQLR